LVNFSVTDPTSSSNVFDASSLSAILTLDIIRVRISLHENDVLKWLSKLPLVIRIEQGPYLHNLHKQ
jgi:hypothetical protein